MADWDFPGLGEGTRARLEEAGFTPGSLARARPSELVRRVGLSVDLARRIIAHYRGEPVENGEAALEEPAQPLPPRGESREVRPAEELEGREWERVWDLGARETPPGAPWRWRGRAVLRVTLLKRE